MMRRAQATFWSRASILLSGALLLGLSAVLAQAVQAEDMTSLLNKRISDLRQAAPVKSDSQTVGASLSAQLQEAELKRTELELRNLRHRRLELIAEHEDILKNKTEMCPKWSCGSGVLCFTATRIDDDETPKERRARELKEKTRRDECAAWESGGKEALDKEHQNRLNTINALESASEGDLKARRQRLAEQIQREEEDRKRFAETMHRASAAGQREQDQQSCENGTLAADSCTCRILRGEQVTSCSK